MPFWRTKISPATSCKTGCAPGGRRPRFAAWAAITIATAIACAIEVPPPGGPEDTAPPSVLSTVPAADSSGVEPTTEVAIEFSEGMTRTGLERLLSFAPAVEIGSVRWERDVLVVRPREPLHRDTTYVVTIRQGFRDAHKVENKKGHQFAFATGAAIDSGTITGTVHFRRKPSAKAVVRCFALPVDSSFTPAAARPDRQDVTDAEGIYEIGYLGTRDDRFLVWAFEDANQNGTYAPESEAAAFLPDTVVLSAASASAVGRDVWIVDPTEPAVIAGSVSNQSGIDSLPVTVALRRDSLSARAEYLMRCSESGDFEFSNVKKGVYLLQAFIDVRPDSACGYYPCGPAAGDTCAEPCLVYPDTLVIEPGAKIELQKTVLAAVSGGKSDED